MKTEWRGKVGRQACLVILLLTITLAVNEPVSLPVQAFGLRPVIIETDIKRGSNSNFTIEIFPTRSEPEGVKVFVTDYIANRDGTFDVVDISEREHNPKEEPTITLLSANELTVDPGDEPARFNFRVEVPPTVRSNEFIYVILFESLNPEKADINEDYRLRLTQRIGVMLIIHVPGFRDIFNAKITEINHSFIEDKLFITPTIENTGNRYVHLSGICRIFDSNNHLKVTIPLMESQQRLPFKLAETPVFTGRMLDIPVQINYPLQPGRYYADFSFNIRENDRILLRKRHEFTIEQPLDYEAGAERELLMLDPESLKIELPQGGSTRAKLSIFNNYFERVKLFLKADPNIIKITNFPVYINPGQTREIEFLVANPGDTVIKTEIKISFESHDNEMAVPVEIFTK